MLGRVALVRTDISKDHIAFINKNIRIGELVTTLAVTSNRMLMFLARRFLSP
jgi:hypothetical protein